MSFVMSSSRSCCLNQVAVIGIVAVLAAGCSSDFARFDADKYGASLSSNQTNSQVSSVNPAQIDGVTTSSIEPAKPRGITPTTGASGLSPAAGNPAGQGGADIRGSSEWTTAGGTAITMKNGETLNNISKRYGVPVTELQKANKLTNADQVHAGRKIIVPIYANSSTASDNNPKTRTARAGTSVIDGVASDKNIVPAKSATNTKRGPASSISGKPNLSDGAGYSVVSGDTLSSIARQHGVRVSDLERANGLNGSSIRVGQKLVIPGKSVDQVPKKVNSDVLIASVEPIGANNTSASSKPKPYTKPNSSGNVKVTNLDEKAPARSGIDTFRWPATGRVLSKFGDQRRGERNEGIDISVPEGTSVKAAENGLVIYSDDELQDYGNLLLIRHDGGWVSAYAHNKTLQVKRGDKVRRGQVIARSGRTGNAERPMIHFELRKDSNPVNPQKYLR